jgi:hypothetical protein
MARFYLSGETWYSGAMPKTIPKRPHPGRRGDPISLAPLTPEQAIRGVFQIKPADVRRIVASKPGRKGKR